MEIERKFLVNGDFSQHVVKVSHLVQGCLSTEPEHTVRVRISDERGFLTIKGRSSESGMSRFEWEREIPVCEAEQLLALCGGGVIDKHRYHVPAGRHVYEVDVFHGKNEGLIIAEIELNSEDEEFEKPHWLGKEVTGDVNYYNSKLIQVGGNE